MPGSGELDRDRLFSRPASSDRSRFFLPAGVTSNPTVAAGWVLIIGAALLMLGVVVGRVGVAGALTSISGRGTTILPRLGFTTGGGGALIRLTVLPDLVLKYKNNSSKADRIRRVSHCSGY